MSKRDFRITRLSEPDNSIWRLYRTRERIDLTPEYQRESDVWTLKKKQALVDSVLNGFDIPKLYFHRDSVNFKSDIEYAVIDGKQRLEALWQFASDKIKLSDEFACMWDDKMQASGMTYSEIATNFPDLRVAFDSYPLTVIVIETVDTEIIEDMFARLNDASPLNAAEKRNAYQGPVPKAVKKIAGNQFFTNCLPFSNSRYRHFDIATKFLFTTYQRKIVDTRRVSLDQFASKDFVAEPSGSTNELEEAVLFLDEVLREMSNHFGSKDRLLRRVPDVMAYFHLFTYALRNKRSTTGLRSRIEQFVDEKSENRKRAENEGEYSYELLEYDRMALSINDAIAMRYRAGVLVARFYDVQGQAEDLAL